MSSQFRYQNDQQSQKLRLHLSDQSKITSDYTNYIIEESNQQQDYVRGMFTKDKIKEAFNFLDINKDGGITSENLSSFLDFIEEKATIEEIEQMIIMCYKDGSGKVKFEDFSNLAGGWSLQTLDQAHPLTKELVEKRTQINQFIMEKEVQEVARKGKITRQMVEKMNQPAQDLVNMNNPNLCSNQLTTQHPKRNRDKLQGRISSQFDLKKVKQLNKLNKIISKSKGNHAIKKKQRNKICKREENRSSLFLGCL